MPKQLLIAIIIVAAAFVAGWYSRTCPPAPVCAPVVQVEPQTVTTHVSTPALQASDKAASREAALQAEISDLKAAAAKRSTTRTITLVKEVPTECASHVERQAKQDASACLEPADIDLINRAKRATQGN